MRPAHLFALSLVMLLAVPVAAAAGKDPDLRTAETAAAVGSIDVARAVGVTDTHVTLQARVVPDAAGTSATFEYGPTTDYGFTAAASPAALPRNGATASASIDGLTPSTTYHFRIVLGTGDNALVGPDATFTTAAPAPVEDDGGDDDDADDKGKGRGSGKELEPVQAPAAPVLGESVAVGPRAGTVKVRSADGKSFTLTAGATIPAGSVIDATNGTVAMTSALDEEGNVQTAEFSGGRFQVRQSAKGDGVVDIYLKGSIGSCRAKTARLAARARSAPGAGCGAATATASSAPTAATAWPRCAAPAG